LFGNRSARIPVVASRTAAVQDLLAHRFPEAVPQAGWIRGVVATGLPALDDILPSGGFQRGRLAVWTPGGGAAALLRATARCTVAGGERVVWGPATATLTGAAWRTGPLLVQPTDPLAALRAAEELARSGGFALVVADGVEPDASRMVRVSRAAHEGGAALVLLTNASAVATLRLRSRPLVTPRASAGRLGEPLAPRAVQVRIEARASGWQASTTIALAVWHDDHRLSLDLEHPDRRGERR
jgi:hypothetical protein